MDKKHKYTLAYFQYGPKNISQVLFRYYRVIRFLIGYRLFTQYMAYVLVKRYSTDNLEKLEIDKKDEQKDREMHTTDDW